MNSDVKMDGRAGSKDKKLHFGEVKLEVMVPHPDCNVKLACRDLSRDCGVVKREGQVDLYVIITVMVREAMRLDDLT